MNTTKSHITLILDRSGSMDVIRTDVIGAVNAFIAEQQKVPGECTFTLVQFDDMAPYEVLQDAVPLEDARKLSPEVYAPRGNTPLLDAIGRGIADLGSKLAAMGDQDRPGKVIFVVQTDGQENASKEYSQARVGGMVKHQSEKYNWQFVFLGANQDAILTGKGLNVMRGSSLSFAQTSKGIQNAFACSSANVASYRGDPGKATLDSYTDEQRAAAMSK